jgi:hypothetical protein
MSDGRSPLRDRQLHDLRLLPTADDPRPTFFWSAEGSRDVQITHTEFPKLLWHGETDVEITVRSREEQEQKLAQGYVLTAPAAVAVDPMADLSDAFAGLTIEEQELIVAAQAKQRRDAITAKLAELSPEALERLLAGSAEPVAKKRGRPAKVA